MSKLQKAALKVAKSNPEFRKALQEALGEGRYKKAGDFSSPLNGEAALYLDGTGSESLIDPVHFKLRAGDVPMKFVEHSLKDFGRVKIKPGRSSGAKSTFKVTFKPKWGPDKGKEVTETLVAVLKHKGKQASNGQAFRFRARTMMGVKVSWQGSGKTELQEGSYAHARVKGVMTFTLPSGQSQKVQCEIGIEGFTATDVKCSPKGLEDMVLAAAQQMLNNDSIPIPTS